ncbi:MAG: FeS assembly protein SufBD [Candidatus Methanoperedenaceae archaeon]|nr:MAG: FeS assembly protein SufBD [Candidatus Methanoperedenaceae archaeon]
MSELDELLKSFGEAGGDQSILANTAFAHLAASGHKILSRRAVKGIELDTVESDKGISATVRLLKGTRLLNPVHLCFGVLHRSGIQEINMRVNFEKDSQASFIAHCIFPKAEKVKHIMDAVIHIGENATMRYSEIHYHGIYGGIEVYPKARIIIGKNGRYFTDFLLINGLVGKLMIDYGVEVGENGVAELIARVFGHATDNILIKDKVALNGVNSKGLIKTRVAIENNAQAQVIGVTEGNARGARGHVDCMEIVKDNAIAKAIPLVKVSNSLAKVTHEAAIGSVDKKQLDTLMAHGLAPEEAVDVIVRGILK